MSNKKMNEHYTVSYLGNVIGGQIISYANVEIEVMKRTAAKSIKAGEAVWFGCDVGKMFHQDFLHQIHFHKYCTQSVLLTIGAIEFYYSSNHSTFAP